MKIMEYIFIVILFFTIIIYIDNTLKFNVNLFSEKINILFFIYFKLLTLASNMLILDYKRF